MKNSMKRILALTLCMVLAFALTACGSGSPASSAASTPAEGTQAPAFDYSSAIDETGLWKDITALDYVTLPEEYKAVPLPEEISTTSEESVDQVIDSILNSASNEFEQITDRAIEDGDKVNMDYVGSVDGVEFSGGNTQGNGTVVTAGSPEYIGDFLTQIIGHKAGDTFDVVVTFPEDYPDSTDKDGNPVELKNKEAVFKTTINYIQGEKILPELNDAFVAEFFADQGHSTVEELRTSIHADLLNAQKMEYLNQWLLNESTVSEVPASMVEHLTNVVMADLAQQAAAYGMDVATLLSTQGIDEAAYKEAIAPNVENEARRDLILQAIIETEKMEYTEDEGREELGDQYDGVVDMYGLGYTNMILMTEKAFNLVMDNAAAA